MEGNASELTQVLTYVRTLANEVQKLTTTVAQQSQEIGILRESLRGEVGSLSTNDSSLQTLIESQAASLTQEQLVRAKLVQGVADEVTNLRSRHTIDHAQVIGLIEEHHGDTLHQFASQGSYLDGERSERIAGDEALGAKLSDQALNTQWYFDETQALIDQQNQTLDVHTWDSDEWTMDSEAVRFQWSLLSAAQEWEVHIGNYSDRIQRLVDEKLRKVEAAVVDSTTKANEALANTDVNKLVEILQGQVGIESLDNILSGVLDDTMADIEKERQERIAQIRVETTLLNERVKALMIESREGLLLETRERQDLMSALIQQQTERFAIEAEQRTAAIEAEAQRATEALTTRTDAVSDDVMRRVNEFRNEIYNYNANLEQAIVSIVDELKVVDAETISSLNSYKLSNNNSVAMLEQNLNITLNDQAALAETVDTLAVGLDDAKADIIAVNKVAVDGDSALASQIDAINVEMGEANAGIQEAKDAVATLDSATATKFSELNADLDGLGTSVANVKQLAESNVTATNAQAAEITSIKSGMQTIEAGIVKKADSSALSSLETKVDGNQSAMSQRVDALAASLTDLGEGAETNVDVYAFNALKAEVESANGVVTGHTSDLNILKASMVNVQEGIEANSTAINSTDVKVVQAGKDITVMNETLSSLTNDLETVEEGLTTKASTESLNATKDTVSKVDGRVTANSQAIEQVKSSIQVVTDTVAKKVDATALNSYYTKTEADDKSASIAAGKVEEFKGSLEIGGDNLLKHSRLNKDRGGFQDIGTFRHFILQNAATLPNFINETKAVSMLGPIGSGLQQQFHAGAGRTITISLWVFAFNSNAKIRIGGTGIEGSLLCEKLGAWKKFVYTTKTTTAYPTLQITFETEYEIFLSSVKVEYGTVATPWSPHPDEAMEHSQSTFDNLMLVQGNVEQIGDQVEVTSSSVEKLSGRVTALDNTTKNAIDNAATAQQTANTAVTNASSVASDVLELTARVANTENGITKKADATALNDYYTISEADQAISGGLEEFKSTFVVGGANLITHSFKNFRVGNPGSANMLRTILADGSLQIQAGGPFESTYLANWRSGSMNFGELFSSMTAGEEFTTTFWFKATDPANPPTLAPSFYLSGSMSYLALEGAIEGLAQGKEVAFKHTRKWAKGTTSVDPHFNLGASWIGAGIILTKWKIERGAISTDWTDSVGAQQAQSKSTAEAINQRYTKAEADRAIASSVSALKSEVDGQLASYDQTIDTWVERNKTEAAMVESLAAELVPHMAGDNSLFDDIEINAGYEGVITALASTDAATIARMDKLEAEFDSAKATIEDTDLIIANVRESTASRITELDSKYADVTSNIKQTYITKSEANKSLTDVTTTLNSTVAASVSGVEASMDAKLSNIKLDSVSLPDTRSDNQPPSWYWVNYAQREVREFKLATAIGLTSTHIGGLYGTLISTVQWSDGSGGPIKQVMQGVHEDQLYTRYSLSTTEWSVWSKRGQGLQTTLQEKSSLIDGIRAAKTVAIDNNGVMSGYGLVSELVNGKHVVSAFGVNADQFYVGSPANGKKVFSVVNGVTVINDAIVGNLTANKITSGQMHGDRITAGTLHANRLVAGSVTADKMNVTSLSAISANLGVITTLKDASRPYGTRMIIQGGVLTVYDDNNVMRARFGFW